MKELSIGELARQTGLRASAIRYYESCGLIAAQGRTGGKRLFSGDAVERLALIAYAKNVGFTLDEIRTLVADFPAEKWSRLAARKLEELDALAQKIETMRASLEKISRCRCNDVDECAHAIAVKTCR
ncbi:MAG TPA: MerR family transcriptional regulator [Thermoanaerobaculia bacterium]|nr:MerR family transcriptional regulator [Thermoanaerobaculia bacterium]